MSQKLLQEVSDQGTPEDQEGGAGGGQSRVKVSKVPNSWPEEETAVRGPRAAGHPENWVLPAGCSLGISTVPPEGGSRSGGCCHTGLPQRPNHKGSVGINSKCTPAPSLAPGRRGRYAAHRGPCLVHTERPSILLTSGAPRGHSGQDLLGSRHLPSEPTAWSGIRPGGSALDPSPGDTHHPPPCRHTGQDNQHPQVGRSL